MKDIIREVTVHRHNLFGEIRTVRDDDGYYLFVISDLASFLNKKSIIKSLNRQCVDIIDVKILCLTAVNNNEQRLEERVISTIKEKDALHMVRSSQISCSRVMEMWIRRDVLRDDPMWSEKILFNREFYKDEYVELQIAEIDLLKAKINILECDILNKVDYNCYNSVDEISINNEIIESNKDCKKVTVHKHPLFGDVRTINNEGVVLFVANDIAKALKYSSPQMAVKSYCSRIIKASINSEIYLSNIDEYSWQKIMINVINYTDVKKLIKFSSKVDKRMFELWMRSEMLGELNDYDKNIVYQGEYYKDEYIKVLSKEINCYREQIEYLEKELCDLTEKIVQDNVDLVTNYDLAKKLETVFKVSVSKK